MKILIAMDTSAASQMAFEEIAARPWPSDSVFEVITVVELSHLWVSAEAAEDATYCAGEVVHAAVNKLRERYQAVGSVVSGDAKRMVLERARDIGADFVIVGSHGITPVDRFLWGKVASAVLRNAPCSVEIVRGKEGAVRSGLKILLAVDGSACSECAAQSVADRPWPEGSEIRILSAVELLLPASRALLEPPLRNQAFMEAARAEAMRRAQDAVTKSAWILSKSRMKVSESVSVLLNSPKAVILDEAAEWGADLIVLGSHGERGIVDRFLLGSVSEAVAVHASCSVEIIRESMKLVEEQQHAVIAAIAPQASPELRHC